MGLDKCRYFALCLRDADGVPSLSTPALGLHDLQGSFLKPEKVAEVKVGYDSLLANPREGQRAVFIG